LRSAAEALSGIGNAPNGKRSGEVFGKAQTVEPLAVVFLAGRLLRVHLKIHHFRLDLTAHAPDGDEPFFPRADLSLISNPVKRQPFHHLRGEDCPILRPRDALLDRAENGDLGGGTEVRDGLPGLPNVGRAALRAPVRVAQLQGLPDVLASLAAKAFGAPVQDFFEGVDGEVGTAADGAELRVPGLSAGAADRLSLRVFAGTAGRTVSGIPALLSLDTTRLLAPVKEGLVYELGAGSGGAASPVAKLPVEPGLDGSKAWALFCSTKRASSPASSRGHCASASPTFMPP